jgi:hypothetical protein
MNKQISKVWLILVLGGFSLLPADAATPFKTVRVDHGRPIIVVSERSVLLLEFLKNREALIPHEGEGWEHCRERYRYQLFDGATGTITNGEGMVEEIYKTVFIGATGREVKDMGSRTGIGAGAFGFNWSRGTAGERSWLYYHAQSPIRFIQQPKELSYDKITRELFQKYLASRNVQEFVSANQTVQVIGPAVFSGDLPTDIPTSARIESARVHDGAFELKLSNLETNKHYIIDSSYELKAGSWNAVHTFIAGESNHEWSDPLGKDVSITFYRIREAAY